MCDPNSRMAKDHPPSLGKDFLHLFFSVGSLGFSSTYFLDFFLSVPGSGLSLLVSASLEAVVPDAQGTLGLLRIILLSSHLFLGLSTSLDADARAMVS